MAESTGILLLNAEDNDLSGLTITEEGSNDLTISSDSALHGSLGYELEFSGNTVENLLYFYKSFTAGADIYARCYFYIPSNFDMSNSQLTILGLNSTVSLARPIFSILTGVIYLSRFYYYLNSGETYSAISSTPISRDEAHYLEIRFKSGNGDGVATVWLDGTEKSSITELTNDNYQSDIVRAGNYGGAVPTAGSKIYIDDIKIDSSYIGAYAESGGSSLPAIINNYRQQGVM